MIFSKFYAECYDQIHSSKGYDGESKRMLEFLDEQLGKKLISRILDFGCGTGVHLNSLDDDHLKLFGYDRNDYMLDIARQKYPKLFFTSDYSSIPSNFDLVYSLFDVVNYQVTNSEVEAFFQAIASKLESEKLLVVDGWHYTGVKLDPPVIRERDFIFETKIITRRVQPHTVNEYRTTNLEITLEDRVKAEVLVRESHAIRAFDTYELEDFAKKSGFKEIKFRDGSDWAKELEPESWRFVMFAEKA